MSQVTIQLNGRTYRLRCDEGQEQRIYELGEYIAKHIDAIKEDTGQIGDDRLLVMASLMITDELWDAREEIESLGKKPSKNRSSKVAKNLEPKVAKDIEDAAERVEALKDRLVSSES